MNVSDLIDILEQLDPDQECQIRLATQPAWPFEYVIGNVIRPENDDDGCDGYTIYLVEGTQIGYLPKTIADEAW